LLFIYLPTLLLARQEMLGGQWYEDVLKLTMNASVVDQQEK